MYGKGRNALCEVLKLLVPDTSMHQHKVRWCSDSDRLSKLNSRLAIYRQLPDSSFWKTILQIKSSINYYERTADFQFRTLLRQHPLVYRDAILIKSCSTQGSMNVIVSRIRVDE
jgi:hypothetical protein